jgi:hypothetical protein
MSRAEYAPKQLPVLTRLATALRRIPVVEFAFAKFKSLLRGRTTTDPIVTSEFRSPAADVAKDNVAPGATEAETVEPEIAQTDPVGTDAVAAEPVEPDSVEVDAAATDIVQSETVEIDAAEIDTVGTVGGRLDDAATPVAGPDDISEEAAAVAESSTLPVGSAGTEIVEIDAAETARVANESAETATVETVAAKADDVAASDVTPDQLSEREVDCVEAGAVETAPVETIIATADIAAPPVAKLDDFCDREALVRRRWNETGIRMWNPRVHGAGRSALCIQGRVALLPPKPGEIMPGYDRLEFKLIDGLIVCEDFVVDPPEHPEHRAFAEATTKRGG